MRTPFQSQHVAELSSCGCLFLLLGSRIEEWGYGISLCDKRKAAEAICTAVTFLHGILEKSVCETVRWSLDCLGEKFRNPRVMGYVSREKLPIGSGTSTLQSTKKKWVEDFNCALTLDMEMQSFDLLKWFSVLFLVQYFLMILCSLPLELYCIFCVTVSLKHVIWFFFHLIL